MRDLVIGTGWFASKAGHNNSLVASVVQSPNFFPDIWVPHLVTQLGDRLKAINVYQSDCPTKLESTSNPLINIVRGKRPPGQHHHNDAGASILSGAMHAYCNECDFMFVEQDCFVVGIVDAWQLAQKSLNARVVYSFVNHPQDLSVGEFCFTYVSYEYLDYFINKLMYEKFHVWDDSRGFCELAFNEYFKDICIRWPFGYGRARPIDWTKETFYFQQPTATELCSVVKLLRERFDPVNLLDL